MHQITTFRPIYIVAVDVSATAAVFVGTTVHQVSLWRTVGSHRCVEVGRTPRLGSSTCLVLF